MRLAVPIARNLALAGSARDDAVCFSEVLTRGDPISLRADRSRSYRVIEGPVGLVSVREHPRLAAID